MALIKNRKRAPDTWKVLGENDAIPVKGNVIVSLSAWRDDQKALSERDGQTGIWLEPADDPAEVGVLPHLIAVNFPAFTDGRGYSIARLLRQRYGFNGELRAVGDVLRDQLFELERCGFDSFQLREDQDADKAIAAFSDFSEAYQSAVDQGALFERRFSRKKDAA